MRIVTPILAMAFLASIVTLGGSVLIADRHIELVESVVRKEMSYVSAESIQLTCSLLDDNPIYLLELELPTSERWGLVFIHCYQEAPSRAAGNWTPTSDDLIPKIGSFATMTLVNGARDVDWKAEWTKDAAKILSNEIGYARCLEPVAQESLNLPAASLHDGVLLGESDVRRRGPEGHEFLLSWTCTRDSAGVTAQQFSMVPSSYVEEENLPVVYSLFSINSTLFVIVALYAFYFNQHQKMTAHALRNRIAALGNKIHNLDESDREDLQRYCEFIDGWIGLFLGRGLGMDEDSEAMSDAVINEATLKETFEIMGGAMDKCVLYGGSGSQQVAVPKIYVVLMLEILFDNARKHADRTIVVSIFDEANAVVVAVEDDGDGIGLWKRVQIASRMSFRHGFRTLRLLVKRAGASFRVSDSSIGGAAVHVRLPKRERP